jgi:hypothetical protein
MMQYTFLGHQQFLGVVHLHSILLLTYSEGQVNL